ncbi:hypothetical protein DM02DRAFT_724086 [Periconia macrospinosa]|uniref:Uncharacterized protein n=1 Tax=Periconia macrospinosa TaxID=97972 RepID=A0A2V1EAT9_9PLEO|nr:hypothetical protein DM02DRAFT_724086 [Periconia macrospinosa]
MPDFTFITTNEQGQVRKGDSKIIRSSCMRGKNERPGSRRVKRRTKRQHPRSQEEEPDEDGFINLIPATNSLGAKLAHRIIGAPLSQPYLPDVAQLSFLDKVDRRSRDIMFKFLIYSVSIDLLYPIEKCLEFPRMDNFLEMMATNRAFLDLTLLITSAMNDFVHGSPASLLTTTHIRAALSHLNALISKPPTEDNLLTIVFLAIGLGNAATIFGDYAAASAHIRGLQQIATMKGGKEHLDKFPKFNFKISRLDLSYSLSTGKKPVWSNLHDTPEPETWQPYFSGSNPLPPHLASVLDDHCSDPCISTPNHFPKFTVVYNDLRCFVNMLNTNITSKTYMPTDVFHQSIHSIQGRLLQLDGKLFDTIAECVRLGMLAVLTTTFRLPGPKMEYSYLHDCLRIRLHTVRPETTSARKMVFWVLMMSLVAVFEVHEDWIPEVWGRLRGEEKGWGEVKRALKSAIWIDYIHDEPAREVFKRFG